MHPALAAAGAACVAIPFVIHLINLRRYKRVPWAAMRFLRSASRRGARRVRIERWALLLLRAMVLLLFGLAIARPYFPFSALGGLADSGVHRVLVIDDSASMFARAGEGDTGVPSTRFDLARAAALSLLKNFADTDAVSVVTLSRPVTRVIGYASFDRRRLVDAIEELSPRQGSADFAGGLRAAREILADGGFVRSGDEGGTVYMLSDFPASVFSADAEARGEVASLGKAAGALGETGLVLVRCASIVAPNVGVVALQVADGGVTPSRGRLARRVEVAVRNFDRNAVRGARLKLLLDDRVIGRARLDSLGGGETVVTRFTADTPRTGSHVLKAILESVTDDAFELDDLRYAAIEQDGPIRVLVVDRGEERETGWRASRYLSTALSPRGAGDAFEVRATAVHDLGLEPLGEYDVMVLCGVTPRSAEARDSLADSVRAGQGLLVFGADDIDRDGNAMLFGGDGLLPVRLDGVIEVDESTSGPVYLARGQAVHPLAAGIASDAESGLFRARMHRILSLTPHAARGETILSFTNGRPAIVTGRYGAGRVLVFGFSADMSWTNLPAKGDFVSLMVTAAHYVAQADASFRNILVGDAVRERITAAESSSPVRLEFERGRDLSVRLIPDEGGLVSESDRLEERGVYVLTTGERKIRWAVNVDSAESDLRSADEETLRASTDAPIRVVESSKVESVGTSRQSFNEVGASMLLLVLAAVVLETWMATRFGGLR